MNLASRSTASAVRSQFGQTVPPAWANIRLWHKADILIIGENFRFRGQSGH